MKELTCLLAISDVIERGQETHAAVLQSIVNCLPPAFLSPADTWARLVVEGRVYTAGCSAAGPAAATELICVGSRAVGRIEVGLRPGTVELLGDERRLLHGVAERVAHYLEHREMNASLNAAERRYQRLLDELPNPIWRARPDGRCDYVNRAWVEFTGQSWSDQQADQWLDNIHPDDRAACLARYAAAVHDRQPFQFQYRRRHHDGTYHLILDHGRPHWEAEGQFAGYVGSFYDIERRRQAEVTLAEHVRYEKAMATVSQRLLTATENRTALADALHEIMAATGVSRVYVFENFTDATGGLCARQICEACAPDATPEIDNPALQHIPYAGLPRFHAALSTGQAIAGNVHEMTAEERAWLEPQQIRALLVLPIRVAGRWHGFLGLDDTRACRAWTDSDRRLLQTAAEMIGAYLTRQQSETRLRQSADWIRTFINTSQDAMLAVNHDGGIMLTNTAAETLFGHPAAELLGQPAELLLAPTERPGFQVLQRACLAADPSATPRAHRIESLGQRADGSQFPIELTLCSGRHAGDVFALAVLRDITDRRVLEQQLATARKLESIGQLAAGIAHEINTPTQFVGDNTRFLQDAFADVLRLLERYGALLAAARDGSATADRVGEIEALLAEIELDYLLAEIPEAIRQSLDGVQRVAGIVRAMRDFSHPGGEERKAIDLNRAIETTLTVARNEWKYVANVSTDLDPGLPPVPCFPGDINQVILNIVVNAAHAIRDRIGPDAAVKGVIAVRTRHDAATVEIRIRDTGTGIPEHIRPRIFDPFFTTKEVGQGTGQGLAVAHNAVVNKHGGTLDFETTMGQGTTFIIRLPLNPVDDEARNSDAADTATD